MHTQAMNQWQADEDEREKANAIRLAKIAGIDNPEKRVEPELPGVVRFNDPPQAELWRAKARNDLVEESITKLESVEPDTGDAPTTSIEDVGGVTPDIASELRAQGYDSLEDLRDASDEELLEVDGIGPKKLEQIREDVG